MARAASSAAPAEPRRDIEYVSASMSVSPRPAAEPTTPALPQVRWTTGIRSRTSWKAAAILMAEHHIGQLPVVDGEQLVGILRARDLVPTDTSHDETTAPIGLGL